MRTRGAPYFLVLPAWIWLAIFFVVPIVGMLSVSLMTGNVIDGFTMTWHFATYADAVTQYWPQILRSLWYGLCATAVCILLGYPIAYWIAFRGGSHKSTYLLLLLLPFFVAQVLRTISWKFILADNGVILGSLKAVGLLPDGAHVLSTSAAVVFGLAYNFLPFMVLPIYAVLERVDHRVVEAAHDLYAGRFQAFVRVVLPMSLPGVFAGVLMVFVPTSSDYISASVLGGTHNTMIGNVIQSQYLVNNAYPMAAAITFILMAILLVGIFSYARALGTEQVMEVQAK
ncbi:spermidine/putrescine transport system permease protein [Spinactinospora alkalitolerans]|uniref:Spermidine/putrescine transport system permease protein n=1 Tax=Spinactinospora alkalitolerans TaxID=687207 RepID=A0A852TPN4_9ACTN|nr:ABC transporter permease [Spinactinospora alkalitolerans]NYE45237.1 spermidine/putrescine transport system permease protein [Spinactinospora alkalitolerans]